MNRPSLDKSIVESLRVQLRFEAISLSKMEIRISVLVFIVIIAISYVDALETGAPCVVQFNMRPSVVFHGEAQNMDEQPPPYNFAFMDSSGRPTNEYTDDIYTIRLTGDTPFRGFLIQARLATQQGFLIGHLRAGEFLPDESWAEQGLKVQRCPPFLNNSITHLDKREKYAIEAKWRTSIKEGPVQFVITVVQTQNVYWFEWRPQSGLVFPSKDTKFASQHSPNQEDLPAKTSDPEESTKTDENGGEKRVLLTTDDEREENSKNADTFSLLPRFNISLGNGRKFSIRVVDDDRVKEKEFPIPPVFEFDKEEGEEEKNNNVEAEIVAPISIAPTLIAENVTDPIEIEAPICNVNLCFNNATCRAYPKENRYQCFCTDAWTGRLCDEPNYCNGHKCKNDADCLSNNETKTYACHCRGEWAGEFCERSCPSYLCLNGGNCTINKDGQYGCACSTGYTGRSCELNIDDCGGNPCQHGATCVDKLNEYECHCAPGFMGERCHRPCQDIYKSCDFWREQDRCESMRPTTRFFDINCAVTCGQCQYNNVTVTTTTPLPPVLEPFEFLLGKWTLNSTRPHRFPLDFAAATEGYYETFEITTMSVIMFGTPSINFSARAYNNLDHNDQHITVGFLTLSPGAKPFKVSLMSTGNDGMTILEEGEMDDTKMELEMVYVASSPGLESLAPTKAKRRLAIRGPYLQETVERHGTRGQKDYFTKYFYRDSRYGY